MGDEPGDELLQATTGPQAGVLGAWHQSVCEHGRRLSFRTMVVYVPDRPYQSMPEAVAQLVNNGSEP